MTQPGGTSRCRLRQGTRIRVKSSQQLGDVEQSRDPSEAFGMAEPRWVDLHCTAEQGRYKVRSRNAFVLARD